MIPVWPYLALAAALIAFAVVLAQWMHAREMVRVLRQQRDAARQEGAYAGERARGLSDTVRELEGAVARAEGEKAAATTRVRELHARCDRAEADRDAFRARAADCQAEVDRAREVIAGLTRERDSADARASAWERRYVDEMTEVLAERDAARAEAERAGQHAATVEAERDDALAKLAALKIERGAKGQFVRRAA